MDSDLQSTNNPAEPVAQDNVPSEPVAPQGDFNSMDYDPISNPEAANGPMPQSPHNAVFVGGDVSQYQTTAPAPEPQPKQNVDNAQLDYDPIDGNSQINALIAQSPNIQTDSVELEPEASKPSEEEAPQTEQAPEEPIQVLTVKEENRNGGKIALVIIAIIAVIGTIAGLYFAFSSN